MELPDITVFPHRGIQSHGAALLEGRDGQFFTLHPAQRALLRAWRRDAHICLYRLIDEDGDSSSSCPRLSVTGREHHLEQEFLTAEGFRAVLQWVCVDLDREGHARFHDPPTPEETSWVEGCSEILRSFGLSWYCTRAGLRGIACLSHPLDPHDWEAFCRDLLDRLEGAGLHPDRLCHWTALFRLPHVRREGKDIKPWRMDLSALAQSIPVQHWIGKGMPDRRAIPSLPAPSVTPSSCVGDDPWQTVDWTGLELLRSKLQAGHSVADHGERYFTLTRTISLVSSRMQWPHPDILHAIFDKTLHTMIQQGSNSAALMDRWIDRVSQWDVQKLEDGRHWLSSLQRMSARVVVDGTAPARATTPKKPVSTRARVSPVEDYTRQELGKLSLLDCTCAEDLYALAARAGSLLGALKESVRADAVLADLKPTLPAALARAGSTDVLLASGMQHGLMHPADVRSEMVNSVLGALYPADVRGEMVTGALCPADVRGEMIIPEVKNGSE